MDPSNVRLGSWLCENAKAPNLGEQRLKNIEPLRAPSRDNTEGLLEEGRARRIVLKY